MLFHSKFFLLREGPALFHCTVIYLCRVWFDIKKKSKEKKKWLPGWQQGLLENFEALLSSEVNFVNMHAACVVCTRTHNLTLCLFFFFKSSSTVYMYLFIACWGAASTVSKNNLSSSNCWSCNLGSLTVIL